MSKITEIVIVKKDLNFNCGAAFLIEQAVSFSDTINIEPKWQVELNERNPYIIARSISDINDDEIFFSAYEAIQKALDSISVSGKLDLSIKRPLDEYFTWWKKDGEQYLKFVSHSHIVQKTSPIPLRINGAESKTNNSEKYTIYHESFRYYRLAQLSPDLFESYRNLWLCFELLLSSVIPLKERESERTWLKRAFKELKGINPDSKLTKILESTTINPFKELYEDTRCRIFHAKDGKDRIPPFMPKFYDKVKFSLSKLTQLVIEIYRNEYDIFQHSSWINPEVYIEPYKKLYENSKIILSDMSSNDKKSTNSFVELKSSYKIRQEEFIKHLIIGNAKSGHFDNLEKVSHIYLEKEGKKLLGIELESELFLSGIDCFLVNIELSFDNKDHPKTAGFYL